MRVEIWVGVVFETYDVFEPAPSECCGEMYPAKAKFCMVCAEPLEAGVGRALRAEWGQLTLSPLFSAQGFPPDAIRLDKATSIKGKWVYDEGGQSRLVVGVQLWSVAEVDQTVAALGTHNHKLTGNVQRWLKAAVPKFAKREVGVVLCAKEDA